MSRMPSDQNAEAHPVVATDLLPSWQRAWSGLGAAGEGRALFDTLSARYSEAHRYYHTLQHLAECLRLFDQCRDDAEHPAEVEMALWFHDAIYDPRDNTNEKRSADWARKALLAEDVDPQIAERVHALILATRHTAEPPTGDASLLVDIDLAILGAGPERFDEYETQVRREYGFVPDFLFRSKRRDILRSFIERPRLYSTDAFHERLDATARANLDKSLHRLDGGKDAQGKSGSTKDAP